MLADPTEILTAARQLPDNELVARLRGLAASERDTTAQLVAHLAVLDTRDVHLRAGYGSLFVYCRDALALAEHEAYNRIEAARAVRRFPVILDRLAEGFVNLTTVRLLAPHLTRDNHAAVLESARGKKRSEIEQLVARLAPWPDVPPSIRKLPPPRPASLPALGAVAPVASANPGPPPAPALPPSRPADVTSLAPSSAACSKSASRKDAALPGNAS